MARIEDYALLGDCASAALVSRQGSIDWLCWPRFDSGACFAALLGNERSRPLADRAERRRMSVGTQLSRRDNDPGHDVPHVFGDAELSISWSPARPEPTLVRIVRGVEGTVDMTSELTIRFDYGLTVPWVARGPHRELLATAGPLKLVLRTSAHTVGRNMRTLSHFKVAAGERVAFVLQCVASMAEIPASLRRGRRAGAHARILDALGGERPHRLCRGPTPCSARC